MSFTLGRVLNTVLRNIPPLLFCLKWFCGTWYTPSPLLRKFSPTMSKIGLFALYKGQQWNDHQPSRDHACQGDFIWRNHFWNSAYPGSTNWARKNLWALPRPRVSFRRWGDCKHCTTQNLSLASQIRENVEKKVSFHLPLFLGCGCILIEALIQSKLKGDFLFRFSFVMNSVIAKIVCGQWLPCEEWSAGVRVTTKTSSRSEALFFHATFVLLVKQVLWKKCNIQ